ncbi:MAG: threonine/serine dehydratase [Pseudomonadota bacterium]
MRVGSSIGRCQMINVNDIAAADQRCRDGEHAIFETPLTPSPMLSAICNADVYLKHEQMQRTGSFKYRGALNTLLLARERGASPAVVAASSGNHGLAVATAARATGFTATVYVPATADPAKLAAIQGAGAMLETVDGDSLQAELTAREVASRAGNLFISPYNDPDVVAGQGTIGLELMRQCSTADRVIVAVGGGGLMSGIATAMRESGSSAKFVGVWPEVACSMYRCLEAGKIIDVAEDVTLSDGTAGGVEQGAITFGLLASLLDERWLISERAIGEAMRWLAQNEHLLVEGSAAMAVAPLLAARTELAGRRVVVVLCGRNIALERFLAAVERASAPL